MFVGGRNKDNLELPLKGTFLSSCLNENDFEKLEDIRLRRQNCTLALVCPDKDCNNNKVIAVGGFYNPKQGEYRTVCEVFDLQLDIWKSNARLKTDRLSPHVISLGQTSALVLGGYKQNPNTK